MKFNKESVIVGKKTEPIKYKTETVYNYIYGNDVEYPLEDLENDFNFMIDVLKRSQDEKLYDFCSNELKNDPVFVYEALEALKEKRLFCIELAYDFLSKRHYYEVDYINVALKAKSINNSRYNIDKVEVSYLSLYLTVAYQIFKDDFEREMKKANLGTKMDFALFVINFPNEKLFQEYIAKKMIEDIFKELDKPLDFYIKDRFNSPDYIKQIGSKQYILNIIKGHDQALGDYAEVHPDLIEEKIKNLEYYLKEWADQLTSDLDEDIFEIIETYYEQHNEIFIDEYITYIARAINMPSLLEYTFTSANERLIEDGYEPIDYYEIKESCGGNIELDDITKQGLLHKLERSILLYLQHNKHRYNKTNKVSNISNIRRIREQKNKLDI